MEFRTVVEQRGALVYPQWLRLEGDLEAHREQGCIAVRMLTKSSRKAVERGYKQIGTLGSGNHYLRDSGGLKPEHVYDAELRPGFFGITLPNQCGVMCHCGSAVSRHQVATDYLQSSSRS